MRARAFFGCCAVLALFVATRLYAATPPLPVEQVSKNVYLVASPIGNVTVFAAKDAVVVIDTGSSSSATQVVDTVKTLSSLPVRYLVNTHHHDDHAGANAQVGKGATVVAQERCQKLMLSNLKPGATAATANVASEVYNQQKTLTLGKERVELQYFGPGHGPSGDMAGYLKFADYLKAMHTKVAAAIKAGKTRDETMAAVTLDEFTGLLDYAPYGMTASGNVGWVYDEMKRPAAK